MEGLNKIFIHEWNVSFYNGNVSTKNKGWLYGVLKLFVGKILFSCQSKKDSNDKNQKGANLVFEFELPLSAIQSFKKTSTSLIFQAITVSTFQKEKYWFSSFDNRDETFLFFEHFLHSSYFERQKIRQEDVERTQSTNMGKELLRTVVDSNTKLATAGNLLVDQGQQLRNASVKMVEMNNDLGVASRFTQGLKAWIPRWRIPEGHVQESFHVYNKDDASDMCSFNVLYRNVSSNIKSSLLKCNVIIEKKGLSVMDDYQKLIQHWKWTDISRVQVVTVWELCITQYLIGEHDKKCSIVSIKAQQLLKHIEKYCRDKVEVISPEVMTVWSQHEKIIREGHLSMKDRTQESERSTSTPTLNDDDEGLYNPHKKYFEVPNNQEMADLSKELTSLKSLALDVQKVQDEQLKEIDELTAAVTKETDRLSKLNRTANRML